MKKHARNIPDFSHKQPAPPAGARHPQPAPTQLRAKPARPVTKPQATSAKSGRRGQ